MTKIFRYILCVFVCVATSFSASAKEIRPTEISGADVTGVTKLNFDSNGRKGLVIVFLSAKCPCSNSHLDELKALSGEFGDFRFLAIHSNVDESVEITKKYFIAADLPFAVLQDENGKWADAFRASKTPHAFVVLASGELVYQGGVTDSKNLKRAEKFYLREALRDVSAGKAVRTPEGRTLGCAITRGEKHVW